MSPDTTAASKPNTSNRSSVGLLARVAVLVLVLVLVVGVGPGLVGRRRSR